MKNEDKLFDYEVIIRIGVIASDENDARNQLSWLLEQLDDDLTPFNVKYEKQGEYL